MSRSQPGSSLNINVCRGHRGPKYLGYKTFYQRASAALNLLPHMNNREKETLFTKLMEALVNSYNIAPFPADIFYSNSSLLTKIKKILNWVKSVFRYFIFMTVILIIIYIFEIIHNNYYLKILFIILLSLKIIHLLSTIYIYYIFINKNLKKIPEYLPKFIINRKEFEEMDRINYPFKNYKSFKLKLVFIYITVLILYILV